MLIDGRIIATELLRSVAEEIELRERRPHLSVPTCAPTFETQKFLGIKKRAAEAANIALSVVEFPESVSTREVVTSIEAAATRSDGIVVQLPFPQHVDREEIIRAVPPTHDVDAFNMTEVEIAAAGSAGTPIPVLPPVVGAIAEIARAHEVVFKGKQVVVVGAGKLVGAPAAVWARAMGGEVIVATNETEDLRELTKQADILILGAGSAGLITPDMIKDGIVIFDAGTSEAAGELRGDADRACAEKASLMTPVPGGIGPITVAVLLRNLAILSRHT